MVVDSPLAAKFNEAYRQLKPYWDAEAHKRLHSGRHPLSFEELITVDDHESHLAFVNKVSRVGRGNQQPTVVLAASGMCAGGRVVNYLKALLGDARNDVLFVGYQAVGTPGRDILRYGNKSDGYVEFDGQRYDIKAGIHALSGYSAHAGQRDLINFVKRMHGNPKEVRIIHGDEGAKAALAKLVAEVAPGAKVWVP